MRALAPPTVLIGKDERLLGSGQTDPTARDGPRSPSRRQEASELDHRDPERLILALREASRLVERLLIVQTRSSGLGLLEFLVLSRAATDEGATPGDAGRSIGLSRSTMAGVSNRLEEGKLVRRHPHPSDRRLVLLKATALGKRVRDDAIGTLCSALTAEAELLGPHDRAAVTRFLERVVVLLNHQADALSDPLRRSRTRAAGPRRARRRSEPA